MAEDDTTESGAGIDAGADPDAEDDAAARGPDPATVSRMRDRLVTLTDAAEDLRELGATAGMPAVERTAKRVVDVAAMLETNLPPELAARDIDTDEDAEPVSPSDSRSDSRSGSGSGSGSSSSSGSGPGVSDPRVDPDTADDPSTAHDEHRDRV